MSSAAVEAMRSSAMSWNMTSPSWAAGPAGLVLRHPAQAAQARYSTSACSRRPPPSGRRRCRARSWSRARWMRCCREWRQSPPAICVPAKRDEFRLLTKTGSMSLPTAAAAAQPRQLHHLARAADALAGAEGGSAGSGRISRLRRRGTMSSTRMARSPACASATWASRRTASPDPTTRRAPRSARARRSSPKARAAASRSN